MRIADLFISYSWLIYFLDILPAKTSVRKAFLFFSYTEVMELK
jgi:hypothetical protein